jgi:hypothetical protein
MLKFGLFPFKIKTSLLNRNATIFGDDITVEGDVRTKIKTYWVPSFLAMMAFKSKSTLVKHGAYSLLLEPVNLLIWMMLNLFET